MKTLKYKFDLDCKVSVYVPSTVNVNESVDNSEQVMNVITDLSKLFGGATASQAVGGWVCENLRDSMKQEAISLEINGQLGFI